MKKQQKRATFEDVGLAQDKLLSLIDECIEENKPLDEKNRKQFIRSYRLATLGLGSEFRFVLNGRKQGYDMGCLGHAAYWIAYQNSNIICIKDEDIRIEKFWLKLRDMLFMVFDPAIELAVKISKEQNIYGGDAEATSYDEIRKK